MAQRERAPSLREEQRRFTRQRLIDAAQAVFAESGYSSATIEEITSAAGASRATFYLHFKGKAEIVQELFLNVLLPEANDIYERLHELENPTWADVRAFVEDTLAYWDRHRAILTTLNEAVAVEREAIASTWSYALTDTSSVLAHYLEHVRSVPVEVARVRAVMLIALLDRFYFFSRLPGVDLSQETSLDALADFWWAAMKAEFSRV